MPSQATLRLPSRSTSRTPPRAGGIQPPGPTTQEQLRKYRLGLDADQAREPVHLPPTSDASERILANQRNSSIFQLRAQEYAHTLLVSTPPETPPETPPKTPPRTPPKTHLRTPS